MNLLPVLLSGNAAGSLVMVVYVVIIIGAFWLFAVRPQKKQQKEHAALLSTLEKGDSILTTSGFYGVVIDVMEEVVIVEFGNNKNCRIPMKRDAIVEIEKPESAETK
jgi:preprotein translocase, YajC subunit